MNEPVYLAPTGSVVNDLFRFVTIRNPQALTTLEQESPLFIPYPYKTAAGTLYQKVSALNVNADSFTSDLKTACEAFKQTTNYLADKNAVAQLVDLQSAERIFNGSAANEAIAEDLKKLSDAQAKAKVATAINTSVLWDNVFLQFLEGHEDSTMLSSITKALKMAHLMANSSENAEKLLNATLIIPQEIVNLVRQNNQPQPVAALKTAKITPKSDLNFLDLVVSLNDLKRTNAILQEKQANKPIVLTPEKEEEDIPAEKVIPTPLPPQIIEKSGLVEQIIGKLDKKTVAILKEHDLVENTSIDYAIKSIETLIQTVGLQITPDATENIAVTNGGLYRMNSAARGSAAGGDDEVNSVASMAYIPVQVADFRVVRQKVICYKAGEVAHIENIMAGEMKERSTRRLQHTEESFSSTIERETTQEKDSQTTERFELQRETKDVMNTDISVNGSASVMGTNGATKFEVSGGFAISNSQSHSNSTATKYAKDTVSRALSRMQERVKEERSRKVVTEFEELQKHILDNRGNSKNVSGLFRWVDKVFENQLYNYGKRMILEFSVIEPAAFYLYATSQKNINGVSVKRPVQPSELTTVPTRVGMSGQNAFFYYDGLSSPEQIQTWNYHLWAAAYGAIASPPPAAINKSVPFIYDGTQKWQAKSIESGIEIPTGYLAVGGNVLILQNEKGYVDLAIANTRILTQLTVTPYATTALAYEHKTLPQSFTLSPKINTNVPVAIRSTNEYYAITITINCEPSAETMKKWQLETFEAIMEAYERKLSDYQRALDQAKDNDIEIRGNNPLYNRVIEKTELKKWCIQMMRHDANNFLPWSEAMQHPDAPADATNEVLVSNAMPWFYNEWAAAHRPLLQLLEGAIDWDLMTYEFLPYFWTNRRKWTQLSQIQDAADPQFQSFLQAGAARVFVPVKRGQEAAIAWYLATQQIKTGKDLDKLPEGYEFIATEMLNADKDQPVTTEGSAWETVVPTSLIVMQASSGAVAGIGLPCNCPKELADGTDISILTQLKQTTTPCPPCNCKENNAIASALTQEKEV